MLCLTNILTDLKFKIVFLGHSLLLNNQQKDPISWLKSLDPGMQTVHKLSQTQRASFFWLPQRNI